MTAEEWLANELAGALCPNGGDISTCPVDDVTLDDCQKCWLEAAKEAVEQWNS